MLAVWMAVSRVVFATTHAVESRTDGESVPCSIIIGGIRPFRHPHLYVPPFHISFHLIQPTIGRYKHTHANSCTEHKHTHTHTHSSIHQVTAEILK